MKQLTFEEIRKYLSELDAADIIDDPGADIRKLIDIAYQLLPSEQDHNYYWLVTIEALESSSCIYKGVLTTVHPLSWIKDKSGVTILNWKEITKAEYDLFNA